MNGTINSSICPMCLQTYKALSQHLRRAHLIKNVKERKLLLNMASGRVNIRCTPCPVVGCKYHSSRLDKHLQEGHPELTRTRMAMEVVTVKRAVTVKLLGYLRATNPQIAMNSGFDLKIEVLRRKLCQDQKVAKEMKEDAAGSQGVEQCVEVRDECLEEVNFDNEDDCREKTVRFSADDASHENRNLPLSAEKTHLQRRDRSLSADALDLGFKTPLNETSGPMANPVITRAAALTALSPQKTEDTNDFPHQVKRQKPDVDTEKQAPALVYSAVKKPTLETILEEPEHDVSMVMNETQTCCILGQTDEPPQCPSSTQDLNPNSDHLTKTEATVNVTNKLSSFDDDLSNIYNEELGSYEDVSETLDMSPQRAAGKGFHVDKLLEDTVFTEESPSSVHGKRRSLPVDENNMEDEKSMKTSTEAPTDAETLVHRLPEAGLNYRRVPPGSISSREPDQSDHEQNTSANRTLTRAQIRDEVFADNLMLSPVSQIIIAISEKIKILFQDRMDIWEEFEVKINSDNAPVIKTANKEITTILKELKRVQRQLEVFNTVLEPSGQLDNSKASVVSSSSGVPPCLQTGRQPRGPVRVSRGP
ncbi:centrosomal protein of 170 kDa protein B-like isoform X4 [Pseudoliparis swirei]|uniref:centrosomal protein of 170 kDa protein B-like isoform X4 n=1 Tax=Pseudoliparis swirei TaxID=2059687 RepID=UPI0024BD5EAE|nr:centrosomal protein of 170 kDa protein B-like isoform X4 [Pseudoliparis swirei]